MSASAMGECALQLLQSSTRVYPVAGRSRSAKMSDHVRSAESGAPPLAGSGDADSPRKFDANMNPRYSGESYRNDKRPSRVKFGKRLDPVRLAVTFRTVFFSRSTT